MEVVALHKVPISSFRACAACTASGLRTLVIATVTLSVYMVGGDGGGGGKGGGKGAGKGDDNGGGEGDGGGGEGGGGGVDQSDV